MSDLTLTFVRRPVSWTVAAVVRAIWSDLSARRAARRTQVELGRLDDVTLKDIGLDRTELASVAWGGARDLTRRQR